jgi:hypothetical protein
VERFFAFLDFKQNSFLFFLHFKKGLEHWYKGLQG